MLQVIVFALTFAVVSSIPIDTPPVDAFDQNSLSEIVSIWFSNDGYKLSGRHVTKKDVQLNPGLTQETGFSNGGLTFGKGTTGYFSVTGIDMRDPRTFINCPAGSMPGDSGSGSICCKDAPGGSCTSDNIGGAMITPPGGILIRARINFGNYSRLCFTCGSGDESKNFPMSSTCTGDKGELASAYEGYQTIFSVPVQGRTDNLRFVMQRYQISLSEHNNGCNLATYYYDFYLYDETQTAYWEVYKYHNIWLEDGKDHDFALFVPRFLESGATEVPLLYIDGKYICLSGDYSPPGRPMVHCLDQPLYPKEIPTPVLEQEITNTKCSLTRLYLGNSPTYWPKDSGEATSQPIQFPTKDGLHGSTFKIFQMWNYHGIAEPSNPSFCVDSGRCSYYKNQPMCIYDNYGYEEWYIFEPPYEIVEKEGCPTEIVTKCVGQDWPRDGIEIGTSENCRFFGDKCASGEVCCSPGYCCPDRLRG